MINRGRRKRIRVHDDRNILGRPYHDGHIVSKIPLNQLLDLFLKGCRRLSGVKQDVAALNVSHRIFKSGTRE